MKELQTEEKTPEKIEETMEEQYYKRIWLFYKHKLSK